MQRKLHLTACLIWLLTGASFLQAQQIIWGGPGDANSEFAGGLNDWSAVGISCALGRPAANAAWVHSVSGESQGGYAGVGNRIESPSFSNGVAIFDSDWLDNNGDPNNFNGGICPAVHRGELISPVINLAGQSTVVLRFNQYFRWYLGPGGSETEPPSSVEVSNNGGASWTKFIINQGLEFDEFTPTDDVIQLDISSVAANQSNVRFKFVFDGDAYFWMIDDVYLLGGLPENDLALDIFYNPMTAQFIPRAFQGAEEWSFSALVSNIGSVAVSNGFLRVSVKNEQGNRLWSDSTALTALAAGEEGVFVEAPFAYRPAGLAPGWYTLEYSVFQPGMQDATPNNNKGELFFFITDNSFWQSADAFTFSRPNFDGGLRPWGWGSFFITAANTQERFVIESVEGALAGENSESDLAGKRATMYLMEVTSFEIGNPGTGIDDGMTNILIGVGEIALNPSDDLSYVLIPMDDVDSGERVALENGVPYKMLFQVDAGVLIGYDDEFLNIPFDLGDGENGTANLYWDDAFIGGNFIDAMPSLVMNLTLATIADERPLPKHYVSVFPNPARNQTTLDFAFDRETDVTITLADLSGKVISFRNYESIGKQQENVSLQGLAAGTYLIRVASGLGTHTEKIIVMP